MKSIVRLGPSLARPPSMPSSCWLPSVLAATASSPRGTPSKHRSESFSDDELVPLTNGPCYWG